MFGEAYQEPVPEFFLGLDLGKVNDYSALALVEKTPGPDGGPPTFDVRDLIQFPLGTPYPAIISKVTELAGRPALRPRIEQPPDDVGTYRPCQSPPPVLVIDATGVGHAVVDMFLETRPAIAATIRPLTITGGFDWHEKQWGETAVQGLCVPKSELVSVVQATLQSGRLKFVPTLSNAPILRAELMGFRVMFTKNANEVYESREGQHDDLVLAVAMAVWVASMPTPTGGWGPNPTYRPLG